MFTFIAGISQFERNLISQRTKEGLEYSRKRGIKGGRKPNNQLQNLEERKGRLFYKSSTLRKKAWQLNFKTHKLRKVSAKYINLKYEAKTEEERKTILRKILGHCNDRTLKIYIDENDREIDVRNTRFDI